MLCKNKNKTMGMVFFFFFPLLSHDHLSMVDKIVDKMKNQVSKEGFRSGANKIIVLIFATSPTLLLVGHCQLTDLNHIYYYYKQFYDTKFLKKNQHS